jgi:DEAD/DEAH box helicase domain-containing protein
MNIVYFDLETQKTADEVGGWKNIAALKLACGVTWSTARNDFAVYWEQDAAALVAELKSADRVIGFNIINFDYEVLKPYAPTENFRAFRSTDMLADIFRTLGFRLSLDSLAQANLGATKTADGLQSVAWFRNGELDKVAEYCKSDVDITRRVYEFGRENGFVYYHSKLGSKLKVNVNWK